MWPFKKRIQVNLRESVIGRLSVCADILGVNKQQAIEMLINAFLDQRYPGIDEAGKEKIQTRIDAKEKRQSDIDMELTGIPMIDRQIAAHSDEITTWIMGTLKSPEASEKKKELAGAMGSFMGLQDIKTDVF